MPYPSLDACIAMNAQDGRDGKAFASPANTPARRVAEFDDPAGRTYRFTVNILSESEVIAIKAATFDLVGYHAPVEFTVPGDGAATLWRFDEFAPTKTTGNSYSLTLTMRQALGL